jgi:transcriptional regulator with XRE-family HTH domain
MSRILGENIRELRKAHGYTQESLSASVGISKSYLCEIENGISLHPSVDIILAIADELYTSMKYLLKNEKVSPEQSDHDEGFYRNYLKLSTADKAKFRKIANVFFINGD